MIKSTTTPPKCGGKCHEQEMIDRLWDTHGQYLRYADVETGRKIFAEALKRQREDYLDLLQEWVDDTGKCTCDEAYTSRGLTDHACRYHDMKFLIDKTNAILNASPKGEE